ncbi:MAG: response regulator [Leptolyngbya sp. Prado105]|jgi:DNA-binding response OmpR family regulator|nr:response regulator [Leptolyngbya sp. Prado105]
MKILLIEDDDAIANAISDVLIKQQYVIDIAIDGEIGRQCAVHANYDLILLDVMLPKLDGMSLCQQLRQAGDQTPILLLTAKDTTTDKVLGLDAGADDYLIKPFDFPELMARIRALLRRSSGSITPILEWGYLRLDPSSCEVTYRNFPVNLTSTEYRLLELFLRNSHRTFNRSAIVDHLWNLNDPPQEATIKSYIKTLRQKLNQVGAPSDLIETVYGLGYRLNPAETQTSQASESSWVEQQTEIAVRKARESFKAKFSDRLSVLEQVILALNQGRLNEELRQQAQHEAHKLAGALGTLGFDDGSRLAAEIEDSLQAENLTHQAQILTQAIVQLRQIFENAPTIEQTLKQNYPLLLVLSQNSGSVEPLIEEAKNWQLQVKTASNLVDDRYIEQGLSAVAAHNPDVVLVDLDCAPSFQTGLTLLSELSEQPLRILVWAEREGLLDRVEVARHGGSKFLHKSLSAAAIFKAATEIQQRNWTEASVLLVDDDPQVLNAMRSRLAASSLNLTTLQTPEQFWQVLNDCAPDLLILDVEMPYLNGIELCRVIRNDPHWSDLPILFLTIHTDLETVHQMFLAGATDCVNKSIVESKLLTRIFNCLERNTNKVVTLRSSPAR